MTPSHGLGTAYGRIALMRHNTGLRRGLPPRAERIPREKRMTTDTADVALQVQGPSWDLDDEYESTTSPGLEADIEAVDALLTQMENLNPRIDGVLDANGAIGADRDAVIAAAQGLFVLSERAGLTLSNVATFANCLLSVDANHAAAQSLQGRLQSYWKRLAELGEPLSQLLNRAGDEVVEEYLSHPDTSASAFQIRHGRERRHEQLVLGEENLISALSQDGIHAWNRLYTQLSGTMSCTVEVDGESRTMGLAQAASLMQRPDEATRKAAWHGVKAAYEAHEETCAAAINAIAGWRLEVARKRSTVKPVHFLDGPAHMSRVSRATLDAMMSACEQGAPLARRAARAMARASGREQMGPWDLRAPAPPIGTDAQPLEFADAIEVIANAYGEVHEDMGAFILMMAKRGWIEGTVTPNKRPGAYCTGFAKSRHPRVYMTYSGSTSDVITLAHELGHAFHSWVMRELPDSQRSYGMSLAETASTFGETSVRNALLASAPDSARAFAIAWEEVAALPTFLLNIPVRYSFEQALYERRANQPLRPAELKEIMSDAWSRWYGDAMSEPDPMFWATKLHFYISGVSFYNFPYSFGYLFSTGVYQRREELGDEFYPRYVALLEDTGRMSAEALADKHLGVKLDDPQFWTDTIERLTPNVERFEAMVDDMVGQ